MRSDPSQAFVHSFTLVVYVNSGNANNPYPVCMSINELVRMVVLKYRVGYRLHKKQIDIHRKTNRTGILELGLLKVQRFECAKLYVWGERRSENWI